MDFNTIWPLIQQAAVVSIVPIMGALGTYAVQQIRLASAKIKSGDLEKTKLASQIGVSAAEQKFKAGMIKDKKTDALEIAKKILNGAKVKYDLALLAEIIEAQVWDSINSPAATGNTGAIITTATTSTTSTTPTGMGTKPVLPPMSSTTSTTSTSSTVEKNSTNDINIEAVG